MMKVFSRGIAVGLVLLGMLFGSLLEMAYASQGRRSKPLYYEFFRPSDLTVVTTTNKPSDLYSLIKKSGWSVGNIGILPFRYSQMAGFSYEQVTFSIRKIDGLVLPHFVSETEWKYQASPEKMDSVDLEFELMEDTSGFEISMTFESKDTNITQPPVVLTFVGSKRRGVVWYRGDVRNMTPSQWDLYADGPKDDPYENITDNLKRIEVKGDTLNTVESPTKVIVIPPPPPRNEIEEAETRLWEMEQTPNDGSGSQYLNHFGKWYLREAGEYRFNLILNSDSSGPWVGDLEATDSLKLAPKNERRYLVRVEIVDPIDVDFASRHSKKIKRFGRPGVFRIFLTKGQIEQFRIRGIKLEEISQQHPQLKNQNDVD